MAKREVTVDEAKAAVGELVFYFQQNLRSYTGITVSEVVKSGSLGHGTAVQGNFDVDLVLYSRDIDANMVARNGYGAWLDKVRRFLEQTLGRQVNIGPGTRHAVQFKYKGIAVDLLLSPYWDRPRDLYQFLRTLRAGDRYNFSVNAAKWQVAFFQKQPNQVKEFAKRAKAWRNKMWPESTGGKGRPKSYLISVLVLYAYETASTKVGYGASTYAIASKTTEHMRYFVTNHDEMNIYWETDAKGYYLIKDYDDLLPDLPRIVDPANPTNNLYMTGISSYRPNDRARDYEPGDGDWTLFKRYIDTLDLTKTVEEI